MDERLSRQLPSASKTRGFLGEPISTDDLAVPQPGFQPPGTGLLDALDHFVAQGDHVGEELEQLRLIVGDAS